MPCAQWASELGHDFRQSRQPWIAEAVVAICVARKRQRAAAKAVATAIGTCGGCSASKTEHSGQLVEGYGGEAVEDTVSSTFVAEVSSSEVSSQPPEDATAASEV